MSELLAGPIEEPPTQRTPAEQTADEPPPLPPAVIDGGPAFRRPADATAPAEKTGDADEFDNGPVFTLPADTSTAAGQLTGGPDAEVTFNLPGDMAATEPYPVGSVDARPNEETEAFAPPADMVGAAVDTGYESDTGGGPVFTLPDSDRPDTQAIIEDSLVETAVAVVSADEMAADMASDEADQRYGQNDSHGQAGDSVGGQPIDQADRSETAESPSDSYRDVDLQPTGEFDSRYNEQLMVGPDGKKHFVGDLIGTQRNDLGQLHDFNGKWASDSNPRPTADLQRRAQHDLDTRRSHEPQAGENTVDDAALDARDLRQDLVDKRDTIWNGLQPTVDKLQPQGIDIKRATTADRDRYLAYDAQPYLDDVELAQFDNGMKKLVKLNQEIKNASEQLGTAGGALATHREFPTAVPISGDDGLTGTSGNFDRVIMIDDEQRAVIIMEEKGVSSDLGSRLVPDPAAPDQPYVRAEQGSTEYLRNLLEHDNKLSATLQADPVLRERLDAILRGPNPGHLRYLLVRTNKEGIVTVTDFKIDPHMLRLAELRLPAGEGR